mgnify:CR=1 FL=1
MSKQIPSRLSEEKGEDLSEPKVSIRVVGKIDSDLVTRISSRLSLLSLDLEELLEKLLEILPKNKYIVILDSLEDLVVRDHPPQIPEPLIKVTLQDLRTKNIVTAYFTANGSIILEEHR